MPTATSKNASSERETPAQKRDYFCNICFEAFVDKASLDEHMKTHRELEVSSASCRMDAKPAGVF